ncbi:MAG: hypothetical protein A2144_02575 [Chloroflexi bacterium RBG_16_50_9]|nr:MAG: hypothetical protein A2144_02575 [Chloroflexi bacterium RBG_16_50_9]
MTDLFSFFNIRTIDILGFFAGSCVLSSMISRKILWIKILLLIGSLSWLTYGIVLRLLPVVIINIIISSTGIHEVIRLMRNRKNAEASTP